MCRQPANPLLSGKHGRPRRVAARAASRGAVERCGAALRGHARDDTSRIRNSLDPVWMFVKKGTNFDQ